MADLPRTHLIAYALVGLAVVVFAVHQLPRGAAPSAAQSGAPAGIRISGSGAAGGPDVARASGSMVVVHVAGAVRRPGVYRLRDGARVDDAVRRAGGAKRRADLAQVNLAAKLED